MATWDTRCIQSTFERIATCFDDFALLPHAINEQMIRRLACIRDKPSVILDVGSGTGNGAFRLRQHYPDAEVIELDMAMPMLRRSRLKAMAMTSRQSDPWLLNAHMAQLPLTNQAVNMLWSNLALHYVHPIKAVLSEWHRVLRPGGCLMFSILGPKTLQEFQDVLLQVGHAWQLHHVLSMQAIGDQLLEAGFSDPVVDHEIVVLTYPNWRSMMQGLRGSGLRTLLTNRSATPMSQEQWRKISQHYAALKYQADWPVTCEVIYGHAWRTIADDAFYAIRSV